MSTIGVAKDRSLPNVFSDPKIVFIQSVVVFVLLWAMVAWLFDLSGTISTPTAVGIALSQLVLSGDWIPHMYATLRRTLLALLLTLVLGTWIGLVIGFSRFWRLALQDYVIVGLASPTLLLAVFPAMWFGIGDTTAVVAATLSAIPFLTQSVYGGVQDLDRRLIDMSATFGVSRTRVIRRVIIPAVMPEWFGGVRYAFAICFKVTALAEVIAASNGLGFMIQHQLARLSFTGLLSWVLLFTAVIVVVEYGVLQPLERRVFRWRPGGDLIQV